MTNSTKGLAVLILFLGAATLYVVLLDDPWWSLTGGEISNPLFHVAISPFTNHIEILGKLVIIDALSIINTAVRLGMIVTAAGTIMGAVLLLGGFKDAINIVGSGLFVPTIGLIIVLYISNTAVTYIQKNFGLTGFTYPLLGTAAPKIMIQFENFAGTFEIPLFAQFTPTFYFALGLGLASLVALVTGRRLPKTQTPKALG